MAIVKDVTLASTSCPNCYQVACHGGVTVGRQDNIGMQHTALFNDRKRKPGKKEEMTEICAIAITKSDIYGNEFATDYK